MPKYYCDYCDVFLTHDSSSVRKSHNAGWKHKTQVQNYYNALGKDKIQEVIDQITRNKNDRNYPPLLMPFCKPGMVLPPNFPPTPGTEKTQKQPPNSANPAAPANTTNPINPNQPPPYPVPPYGKPGQMPPGMMNAPIPGQAPIPGMNHPIPGAPGVPGIQPPINKNGFPPNIPPPALGSMPTGAPGIPGVPGVPGAPPIPGTVPPPGLPTSISSAQNDKDSHSKDLNNTPPGTNNKRSHDSEETQNDSNEGKRIKH